jgi:hypothetical protein
LGNSIRFHPTFRASSSSLFLCASLRLDRRPRLTFGLLLQANLILACTFLLLTAYLGLAGLFPACGDLARSGFLQERLELGVGHFDRVEIGRVWRQVAQLGTAPLDCCAHG